MGVKNDIFWSDMWSGFGEPGGTPPPRIPIPIPVFRPGLLKMMSSLQYSPKIMYLDKNANKKDFLKPNSNSHISTFQYFFLIYLELKR